MAIQRAVAMAGFGELLALEPIGVGGESEIFRADCTGGSLVIRQYQRGAGTRAEVEWGVMRHLAAVGFPVPKVYGLIDETEMPGPFLMMELLPGGHAWSKMAAMSPLLVKLHQIDPLPLIGEGQVWPEIEAAGLLADPGQWASFFGVRTADLLEPGFSWVARELEGVTPEGPALLHTDWHGMNILHRADGTPVVIDWASAAIGDPRFDVGYAMALYEIEGMAETAAGILAAYEAGRGAPVGDIQIFKAIGALRRLGIFLTMLEEGGERLGLQPGAVAQMRQNRGSLREHLRYLEAVTGLSLPAVAEAIAAW